MSAAEHDHEKAKPSAEAARRAEAQPAGQSPLFDVVRHLQRSAGNHAVTRMLGTRPSSGVTRQGLPVQRHPGHTAEAGDEAVQRTAADSTTIQRHPGHADEADIQRREDPGQAASGADLSDAPSSGDLTGGVIGAGGNGALDAGPREQEAAGVQVSRMLATRRERLGTLNPARGTIQRVTAVQRVRIDGATGTETLLWDQNIPGTATAANGNQETQTQQLQPRDFSAGGGHYDITREDNSVHIDVRIVFVDSGANAGKAIPEGDPRRAWATGMCQTLVHTWNGDHGRFELFSRKQSGGPAPTTAPGVNPTTPTAPPTPSGSTTAPAPATPPATGAPAADPNEVHLGMRFSATAVFDISADANFPRIHVHGTSETATGSLTNNTAITAGDWFMNKNDQVYPASPESIYAHEYGHLMGIPDEYSQNNPQMHALFHRISPLNETKMNDALDRAATDMLVLKALQPKLLATVNGVSAQVAAAIQAGQQPMAQSLAHAIRESWRNQATVDSVAGTIRLQLEAAGQQRAAAAVPTTAHFEAYDNLSNITLAQQAVRAEIDPAHIQAIVQASFQSATNPKSTVTIHYPGGPGGADTSMTVSMATSTGADTNAATGPLATAAQAAATASTTPAPVPAGRGHVPNVQPSNTIIGQLTALPAAWKGVPNLMDAQTGDMGAKIQAAVAGMTFDVGAINDSVPALYRVIYEVVQAVSNSVATQAVRAFLTAQINPIVDAQVHQILSLVENEVQGQAGAAAANPAAAGTPPDPQVAAAAHQMAGQVQTLLARPAAGAAAGTGTGAAATQTAQDVSYTVQSQMGNNAASNAVRPDQMQGIVGQFNSNTPALRHADEDPFAMRNK